MIVDACEINNSAIALLVSSCRTHAVTQQHCENNDGGEGSGSGGNDGGRGRRGRDRDSRSSNNTGQYRRRLDEGGRGGGGGGEDCAGGRGQRGGPMPMSVDSTMTDTDSSAVEHGGRGPHRRTSSPSDSSIATATATSSSSLPSPTVIAAQRVLLESSDGAFKAFSQCLAEVRHSLANMTQYHEMFPVSVETTHMPLFEQAVTETLPTLEPPMNTTNTITTSAVIPSAGTFVIPQQEPQPQPLPRHSHRQWYLATNLFEVEYYYHCEADGEVAAEHTANSIILSGAAFFNIGLMYHLRSLILGDRATAQSRGGHERRSAARYYRLVNRCMAPLLSGEERADPGEYQWIFILLSAVNNLGVLLSTHPSSSVNKSRQPEAKVTFEELYHVMDIAEKMIMSKEGSLASVETTKWWDGMVRNCTDVLLEDEQQRQQVVALMNQRSGSERDRDNDGDDTMSNAAVIES